MISHSQILLLSPDLKDQLLPPRDADIPLWTSAVTQQNQPARNQPPSEEEQLHH